MTITYPTGAVREAILLPDDAVGEDTLALTMAGENRVRVFTRVRGAWYSEASEPVTIAFEMMIGI
jgi:hypothetical protein